MVRRRVTVAVLSACVVLLAVPMVGYALMGARIWRTIDRQKHAEVTVAAATDANTLLKAGVLPQGWVEHGTCRTQDAERCVQYSGTADLPAELTADAAAPLLAQTVRAAGLAVGEVVCGDVPDGARQCLVEGKAERSGGVGLVTFLAFIKTGTRSQHVTFAIDAG